MYDMAVSTVLTDGVTVASLSKLALFFVCFFALFCRWGKFHAVDENRFPFVTAQDVQRIRALIGRIFGEASTNGLALILGQAKSKKLWWWCGAIDHARCVSEALGK